jgi:O-antigen ligase
VIWLLAVNTLRQPWQRVGLVACLLTAPGVEAAIGLAQFASGDGPPSFRLAPGSPFVRAYGTIGQPNSFAGYLNMAWPLALALAVAMSMQAWHWMRGNQRRTRNDAELRFIARACLRWWSAAGVWLTAALLLAALGVSFSRGGWLGAAFGLTAMSLLVRTLRRWILPALVVLGLLLLALGGLGILPSAVAGRLASITRSLALFDAGSVQITDENFAVVERMAQLQAGWRMFAAHPLGGVGPGNYTPAYSDFAVLPWYASRGHAHNYYLHIAAEAGAFGLLAYIALLIGTIRCGLAALRRIGSSARHSLVVGCCGIIATTAGHNIFENLHVLSLGIQLAAVWGLLDWLASDDQEQHLNTGANTCAIS